MELERLPFQLIAANFMWKNVEEEAPNYSLLTIAKPL
jgi:hypothetical protein